MPFTESDIQNELNNLLLLAQNKKSPFVDVKSGDLHRRIWGYPAYNHRSFRYGTKGDYDTGRKCGHFKATFALPFLLKFN
jgi:hypothetical protein